MFLMEELMVRLSTSHCRYLLLAGVCLLSLATGCQRSEHLVLHRVSGTLTRNGKPVPELMVHFIPVGNGRGSTGISDADGKFTLKFDSAREGAIPGEHRVWVQYLATSPQEEMAIQSGKQKHSPEVQAILAKYGSLQASPLKQEVRGDTDQLEVKLD